MVDSHCNEVADLTREAGIFRKCTEYSQRLPDLNFQYPGLSDTAA